MWSSRLCPPAPQVHESSKQIQLECRENKFSQILTTNPRPGVRAEVQDVQQADVLLDAGAQGGQGRGAVQEGQREPEQPAGPRQQQVRRGSRLLRKGVIKMWKH